MLATQEALALRLAANATVQAYHATIIGLDDLTEDTPLPAILLHDGGRRRYKQSRQFFRERWEVWLLAETGDTFTLQSLAEALTADLDGTGLDHPTVGATAGLVIDHLFDGPSVPDAVYKVHRKVQYYEVLTQQL